MTNGSNPLHGYDTPPAGPVPAPSPHRPTFRPAPRPPRVSPATGRAAGVASRRLAGAAIPPAGCPIAPGRRRTWRQWVEALTGAAALCWAAYILAGLTMAGLLVGVAYLILTGGRP